MAILRFMILSCFTFAASWCLGDFSLEDSRGRKVRIKANARIVSGFVGADEILYHLLESQPKRILALSPLAKDKRYSSIYKKAAVWSQQFGDELEALLAMKPDLVIVASYTRPEWLNILDRAGVQSYVIGNFSSIKDIQLNIKTLGDLVQMHGRAKDLLKTFDQGIRNLQKTCGSRSVSILNYSSTGTVLGRGTIFTSALESLGLENSAAKAGVKGWARVSRESILQMNPDFIVVEGTRKDKSERLKELKSQVAWRDLAAVKRERLIFVPSRYLSSVSHYLLNAMELICEQI